MSALGDADTDKFLDRSSTLLISTKPSASVRRRVLEVLLFLGFYSREEDFYSPQTAECLGTQTRA